MLDEIPHRTISGYVDYHRGWIYSVYDRNRFDWIDTGTDREHAEKVAVALPDVKVD